MKEYISSRQSIAIAILFIFGSSVIMGVSTDAHQDSWISLILSIIISIPLLLMYARIIKLFPGYGFFDIIESLFGKIIGKIIIILMTWYAIHLGSLVLRNFYEFIDITALHFTPKIVIMLSMILITIYLARSNIAVLGKWGIIILLFIVFIVIITVIFSVGNVDFHNILPIFEHSPKDIFTGALKILTFPFGEIVLFLPLANFFKKESSPYKFYMYSLFLAGVILLIVILRNLFVLGAPLMVDSFFPSYTAARVIEIGDFLTRIEGAVTIDFVFAGITKIVICLIVAAKGLASLFAVKNFRNLVFSAGLLILAISAILYQSVFEMFEFVDTYAIYAIPFQIIIPLVIWIKAEILMRKSKGTSLT